MHSAKLQSLKAHLDLDLHLFFSYYSVLKVYVTTAEC